MSAQIVLGLRLLISILIYAFLFVFLYSAWRSIFPSKKGTRSTGQNKLSLRNTTTKEIHIFQSREIYIGRSDDAHFQVIDEAISNLHTRIFWKNSQWWIEDLGSTNGTFVNRERIISPEIISAGDQFTCGATEFEILFDHPDDDQK